MAEEAETQKNNQIRERSPSFPFIPLEIAVSRVQQLADKFGRHPAPLRKAGLAWGMKENSSQAFQTLAAIKSFGLISYEVSGKERAAVLTDDARTYLRAQQEQTKKEVLRRAALTPKEIAKYWRNWRADPPPDEVRLDDLVLGGGGYTEEGAKTFLRVYDSTIAYAGLADSGNFTEGDDESEAEEPAEEGHNSPPRRQPPKTDQRNQPPRRQLERGMKEATFPLDEGTGVVQWPEPMSEESYAIFEQFVQLALLRAKASISAKQPKPADDKGEDELNEMLQ